MFEYGELNGSIHFHALIYIPEGEMIYYLKRYYEGETNRAVIEKEFKTLTGESFKRMMDIDLPNLVGGNKEGFRNPSKYMLYNDLFFGWLDTQGKEGVEGEYKKLFRKFSLYANQSDNFAYLYNVYAKLCRVLSIKYGFGIRLREAYKKKDVAALKGLICELKKAEKRLCEFYEAFRNLWYAENKPNGFEVQDMRLGGLLQRWKNCRRRLQDYIDGKETSLPELEEVLLDFWGNGLEYGKQTPCHNDWGGMMTVNQLN